MKFAAGATIGAYEVVSLIGAGGMGEVYRARDTRLRRDVALKVLSEGFAADRARLSRFQREAEVLASLNHPNIAAIYGIEDTGSTTALVLELVEGPTLADRLARGPLPMSQALDIARQLADALDAAHERGIVHRDLKPANMAITAGGTVKVLDFGLAAVPDADSNATTAPTMTRTMPGTILGTPAYMSPEQATGGSADRSADVWAFGCVVYEMLTGRRAFDGSTVSQILANVLGAEPDHRHLPDSTPDSVRRLLERCLQKDPKRRLRDIRDARLEIDDALAGKSSGESGRTNRRSMLRERLAWAAALAVAVLIAGGLAVRTLRPADRPPEIRFEIQTPPGLDPSVAISPDGLKIVYTGLHNGVSKLWLRPLASSTATPLAGTEGGSAPFWSPDSRSIGFFAGGALKRVGIEGGFPRTITSPVPGPTGGAWNADGVILFGANPNGPLVRVSQDGGDPLPATTLLEGERSHSFPVFLQDGRRFLFVVTGGPEVRGVHVGTLGVDSARRLVESDSMAVLTAAGPLLFVRQGTLWAQRVDHDRLELEGAPTAIDTAFGDVVLAGSPAGPIAFRRSAQVSGRRRFTWMNRSGQVLREVEYTDGAGLGGPALSNDGRQVAVFRFVNGNMDIWKFAVNRDSWDKVTTHPADEIFPVWSPDDTEIVFGTRRSGPLDLYRKRVAGPPGEEELLLSTPDIKFPMDWSRDGRFLLYNVPDAKRGYDIWALPLGSKTPSPVVQTEYDELFPQASPSGGWMAYQSNRTGRHEIYLRPFPEGGADVPVSNQGGTQVRWHPNGRELFYVTTDNRLMVVALRFSADGQRVEPELPRELFATPLLAPVGNVIRQRYAVAPDGASFLVNSVTGDMQSFPITVVLNWKLGR